MKAVSRMQAAATHEGTVLLETINIAAAGLARMMQAAHGGDWRVQIEHDAEFVMIARRADRRPAQPKRGEVA